MKSIKLLFLISTLFLLTRCAVRSDKEIETDVSVNVQPTAPDITVSVRDGVATLSGMVKDSVNWRKTIEAAKSADGVIRVEDKLHVANPKPANQ